MPKLSFDGVPVMAIVGADGKDLKEYIMEVNQLYSEYQVQQDTQEGTLTALNNIRDTIQERGPKRAIMASLESMGFGSLNPDFPVGSYTERFSKTNYQVSLEEIDVRRAGIIAAIVAAGAALLWKMVSWIKNRFFGGDDSSGGGGGGSSSGSSSSSSSKPARSIATIVETVTEKEENLTEKIEKFQGSIEEFNKALKSSDKSLDEKYAALKERMEKVMYTKWADFFISPTETNLFTSWRRDTKSLLTSESAQGIAGEFKLLDDEVSKAATIFTEVFTSMEQKVDISDSVFESMKKGVDESIASAQAQYAKMASPDSLLSKLVKTVTTAFGTQNTYNDFQRTIKENNGISQAASIVQKGIIDAGNIEVKNPGWEKIRNPTDLGKRIQNNYRLFGERMPEVVKGEIELCYGFSSSIEKNLDKLRAKTESLSKSDKAGLSDAAITRYNMVRIEFSNFRAAIVNSLTAINCMLNIVQTVERHYIAVLTTTMSWIEAATDFSLKSGGIGSQVTDPDQLAIINNIADNGGGDRV